MESEGSIRAHRVRKQRTGKGAGLYNLKLSHSNLLPLGRLQIQVSIPFQNSITRCSWPKWSNTWTYKRHFTCKPQHKHNTTQHNWTTFFLKPFTYLCGGGGILHMSMLWYMCRGWKTTCRSQFSPLTMWASGIKLRLSYLTASSLTNWVILLPPTTTN